MAEPTDVPVDVPVEPVRGPGDVDRLTPEQQAETNTRPMEPPRGGVPITDTPPRWQPWFVAGHVTEYEFRDVGDTREFRVKPTGIAAAHTRVPNAETGKMEYFDEAGEPIPLE